MAEQLKHTEGEMQVDGFSGKIPGYGEVFHAGMGLQPPPRSHQQAANASRLGACWNACAGVEDEMLPKGFAWDALEALRGVSLLLNTELKQYQDEPWAKRVKQLLEGKDAKHEDPM